MANFFDDVTAARSNVLDRLSSGQAVDPTEREQLDQISAGRQNQFRNGLRRAAYNASATSQAFVGQMAEPFAPEFADRQFEDAERISRTQPAYLQPEVKSFRDVNSLRSAASYASGALGEGLASVGTMVAAGLVSRGAAFRAAPAARNAAQYAGGMAAMLPQEGGETALGLRQNPAAMANTTPAERAALTLGRGTVNAALENIVPQMVFTNAITGAAGRIAPGAASALTNIARKGAAGVVGEGATEAAQEFTGQAAENIAAPGTGYDAERALEAAVRGAITGGVLGGAGGTVQAARSNITDATERAQEAAANVDTSDLLNRTVERIDSIIRNPEEFGADLTNTTLGSLAVAQERAAELGRTAEERAAPAVASGMDAVAELRRRLDVGIAQRLTPENVDKYAELTKNLRLMSGVEYKILTDALRTNDPAEINRAVGTVSRVFARRVPRETLDGLKSITDWSKRFAAGVTNAARARRAAVTDIRPSEINDFADYLADQHPSVLRAIESTDGSTELMRQLITLQKGNSEGTIPSAVREAFRAASGEDIGQVLLGAREWTGRDISREEAAAIGEAVAPGNTARIAENADMFFTDDVREALEEEGIDLSRSGVTYAEDGTVFDANGNQMDPEEVGNTPYSTRELVQRIQTSATYNGRPTRGADYPAFNIPVTYESADGRATPEQIARLLGAEDVVRNQDGSYARTRRDPTDEELAGRITEDGQVQGFLSPMAIAANTGKPEAEDGTGGFKETFSRFVPDFENTNRDVGVQAYRLLSALSSLDTDGIELAPDQIPQDMWAELGITEDSEPLKITANVKANALNLNTVVSRKQIGNRMRNVTMGDLLGVNRAKRRLDSQLELLQTIVGGENANVSQVLNQMVDRDGDITADAALRGLKKFARENKISPNPAVPGYMAQLERRFNDTVRRQRFSRAMKGLERAYQDNVVSLNELDELHSYKSLLDTNRGPVQPDEELEALAEFLQSDLDVDWQTNEELVEMLDAFFDDVVPQVDTNDRDIIENANEGEFEDTPDQQFDAFRRRSPEGRETAGRVEGRNIALAVDEGAGPGPRSFNDVVRGNAQIDRSISPRRQELIDEAERVERVAAQTEIDGANADIAAGEAQERQMEANRGRVEAGVSRETAPLAEPVDDGDGALRKAKARVADREILRIPATDGSVIERPVAGEFTLFGETFVVHKDAAGGSKWTVAHKGTTAKVVSGVRSIAKAAEDAVALLKQVGRERFLRAAAATQNETPAAETEAVVPAAPTPAPTPIRINGQQYNVVVEESPNKNGNIAWNRADGIHMVRGLTRDRIITYLQKPELKTVVQRRQAEVREAVSARFESEYGRPFVDMLTDLDEQQLKKLIILHEARHAQQREKYKGQKGRFAAEYRKRPVDFEFDANRFALRELGLIDTADTARSAEQLTPEERGVSSALNNNEPPPPPPGATPDDGDAIQAPVPAEPTQRLSYQKRISRADLRANPNTLYVFGDNMVERGMGGQAKETRGEPNAVGIPTKKFPHMRAGAFFTDADFGTWFEKANPKFQRLKNSNRPIVWPEDGIGTGLAQLQQRAPRIWAQLEAWRAELEGGRVPQQAATAPRPTLNRARQARWKHRKK
jgi:hypothetical protein